MEILNCMLVESLRHQSVEFNFIGIDTRKYKFNSAAQAYNSVLSSPHKYNAILTEYLMFTHQDIAFDNSDFLLDLEQEMSKRENSILGFAGMTYYGKVVSNLKYKNSSQYITSNQIETTTEVVSLDECCFAMPMHLWEKVRFDDMNCFHWHLYAVDFCYSSRLKFGIRSYVLSSEIYHKLDNSRGLDTDNNFLKTIYLLTRKYRKSCDVIYAPCYIVPTFFPFAAARLFKSYIKNTIK